MTALFHQVLNMSMTGSVVTLFVLAARLIMRRAPKIYSYVLWAVVLFRLLCPVSLSGSLSVLQSVAPQVDASSQMTTVVTYLPAELAQEDLANPLSNDPESLLSADSENTEKAPIPVMTVLSYVWLTGAAVMSVYALLQYILLRRKLMGAARLRDNVYLADHIYTPFVLGILSPKIYLPADTPKKEQEFIIAHERHHICRGDHFIKLMAFIALCIHWFNPLVWAAFLLAGKDMEMSCDEAVVRKLGEHIRADYAASLLRLSTHKTMIAGTPLSFGEGDTKGRIRNMAKWHKPKKWAVILCIALSVAVLVACGLNPVQKKTANDPIVLRYNELTVELPAEFAYSYNDDGSLYLIQENRSVGGVKQYLLPEEPLDVSAHRVHEICQTLGVPEATDATLVHTGGASLYGHMEIRYWSELEPEETDTIHYVYLTDHSFYDVWFDNTLLGEEEMIPIIRTAYCNRQSVDEETTAYAMEGSTIQYGRLALTLPEGYSCREDQGNVVLIKDSVDVGGITWWNTPEIPLSMPHGMDEWIKALGLPEAQDTVDVPIAYMIESGVYGDLHANYFNELSPETLNATHEFFISGKFVYDVWYDENQINDGEAAKFLQTIQLAGEPVVKISPDTEADLEKCREVLRLVQTGDYIITSEKLNEGSDFLNKSSQTRAYRNGQNWMNLTTVPQSGILDGVAVTHSVHAYMYVDGTYYSNETAGGLDENGDVIWSESQEVQVRVPWLATYPWSAGTLVYMDTLIEGEETCVMLRVDEPHPYGENNAGHYFVNFYFDNLGNFIRIKKQVNMFQDNEYTETEAIVTLDSAAVQEKIEAQHDRVVK